MSSETTKKDKKENFLISLLKGCGCFFIISFLVVFVISLSAFIYLKPIVADVRSEKILPEFEGPTEQDFWSLQEKILNKKVSQDEIDFSNENWDLTPGEFNALLSSVQMPPVSGFCLSKVRHEYKNKTLRYYFIGSGYMLRRLIISFIICNDGNKLSPSEIYVNNWKVPGESLEEKFVKTVIFSIIQSDKTNLLNNLFSGKLKPYEK